jgi:hypothetical protein
VTSSSLDVVLIHRASSREQFFGGVRSGLYAIINNMYAVI